MTSAEKYSTNAVCISYFDPFDIFESIKQQFLEIFPLQNVHWKATSGNLRTIDQVSVNLVTETKTFGNNEDIKLFVRFVVVSCISADDYRAKVRPLIRQWLPISEADGEKIDLTKSPLPVILLYANSEVVDFKLFKSTSLIDKLVKDFPDVKALEIKSVYKSPKEKEVFWGQMSQHLKSYILDVFQSRLTYNQAQLKKATDNASLADEILFREKIMELCLALNMPEEAKNELELLKRCLWDNSSEELAIGKLEVPFRFPQDKGEDFQIAEALMAKKLTKYEADKYFFVKEFQMIMRANTKSLSCLRLYKLIRGFLCSVADLFRQESGFLEFKFSFLDCCLQHLSREPGSAFKQMTAELLLAKRDCWVQGVLGSSSYTLMGKTFPETGISYSFGRFQDTYDTEDEFHTRYMGFTKEIIALFSQCDVKRQRTVDILSIEIGFLHYQRKEYEKAVALFLSCYEYYVGAKWDLIGITILKVFVHSLVQSPNLTEIMIDDEMVPTTVILSNAYLNILRISGDKAERGEWWAKFVELHQNGPTDLVYATDGLFDVSFANHVLPAGPNTLSIDILMENNKIPEDLKVDSITFLLKRDDDSFIKFQARNLLVSRNKLRYPLRATHILYGIFNAVSVEMCVGTTTFVKEFLSESTSELLIEPFYDSGSVTLMVEQAPRLNLGEYALQLSCSNCNRLKSAETIITIKQENLRPIHPVSFTEEGQGCSKHITKMDQLTTVPYYLKETVTSFTVIAKFTFTRNDSDTSFSEVRSFDINCCLPVSVSVEDIFRRDLFIFKFLLNSSTIDRPVILHNTTLLAPFNAEQYSISGHFEPETPLYLSADPNENCLNCYQITTKQFFKPADCFHLQISYNTLKEQLDNLVTDAVLVQGNVEWYQQFEPWKYVWESTVLPLLHYNYDAFRENMVVALNKGTFNLLEMSRLFRRISIDHVVGEAMTKCLLRLIKGVQLSEIDISSYTKNLTPRKLLVPVELPRFEQFFYVEFITKKAHEHAVGIPLKFNIKIESLNANWGYEGLAGNFLFEIISSNEWLVHGKKRFLITNEMTEILLHVIPLKRGYLNFPKVEITNIETDEPSRVENSNCFDTVLVF